MSRLRDAAQCVHNMDVNLARIGLPGDRILIAESHFAAGSMRPKVEAAVRFIRGGGKRAVITSIEAIESAVKGEAGTEITL